MSHRVNKKRRGKRDRQSRTAVTLRIRKSNRAVKKRTKGTSRALPKFSAGEEQQAASKNGAPIHSKRAKRARAFQYPKSELEAAIQRFVDLYDFAPIAYVSFDRAGRIEEANLAATELLGEPRDLLIGRPFAFYVGDLDSFMRHLLYCRTSQQQVETELQLKPRKSERIPALLCSTPITSTTRNGAMLYQTAIMDLRERKRAEEALRAKEAELEAIINRTPFMLTRCSRDRRYRFVSLAYAKMLGRTPEEIAGRAIVEIIGEKGLRTISPYIEKVLKGQTVDFETEVPYRDVEAPCVHCVYTPDRDSKGKVIGWFASITDITRRKLAETALQRSKKLLEQRVRERTHELRAANKELEDEIARRKGLEGEILEISDREQQRLGQELHDGLCQHLTAVAFMARSTALRLKNHRVIEVSDIEKIAELVNEAATDTRNLSRALHRVDIDSVGFITALQDLVDREIWKTPCRLEVKPPFHIEDDAAASHLYRIAREAVINANKHAQAREIVVALARSRKGTVLTVTDNGVGLPNTLNRARGLGFHIMHYRARAIGGHLEIERPKKGGTRVVCYLSEKTLKSHKRENTRPSPFAAKITKALAAFI
jgi:PAS domain S-box-containing protein